MTTRRPNQMAIGSLDQLPAEILISIAAHLNRIHRSDLSSLALTSRACHAAATFYLFLDIRVRIKHPQKLRRDVDRWLEVLGRTNSARHVRRLEMTFEDKTLHHSDLYSPNRVYFMSSSFGTEALNERKNPQNRRLRDAFVNPDAWAPMVELLVSLTGLTNLVVEHETSFSRHLVEALRDRHTECLLDLRHFDLHCIDGAALDPHDISLILSPQLQSISIKEYYQMIPGHINEIAVLKLVNGLAPGLKMVNLEPAFGARHQPNYNAELENQLQALMAQVFQQTRIHWRKALEAVTTSNLGSLPSLSLQKTSPERLRAWSEATDFAALRHLKLSVGTRELQYLSQCARFPCLDNLDLNLGGYGSIQQDTRREETLDSAAVEFLVALPALASLSLAGYLSSSVIDLAFLKHGASLLRLKLRPMLHSRWPGDGMGLTPQHVDSLPSTCPLLEDLTIKIAVSEPGWNLTEICESIGQNRRLRALYLTIDETIFTSTLLGRFRRARERDRISQPLPDMMDEYVATSAWDTICEQGCRLELMHLDALHQRAGVRKSERVYQIRRVGAIGEGMVAETLCRCNGRLLKIRE
ncbi:hypothetical protein EsH8_VIII_000616 [Colletotrichum jinshuiense]